MAFIPSRRRETVPLLGGALTARSKNAHAQTLINWYPEVITMAEKSEVTLYPTPGSIHIKNVGVGPHRGAIIHKDLAFFVSGNELISMDENEVLTSVGTLNTYSGRVS